MEMSVSPTTSTMASLASRQSVTKFAQKIIIPNNQQQQQQPPPPSYVEVFIPPRASIVNYFMAKVNDCFDSRVWKTMCACRYRPIKDLTRMTMTGRSAMRTMRTMKMTKMRIYSIQRSLMMN